MCVCVSVYAYDCVGGGGVCMMVALAGGGEVWGLYRGRRGDCIEKRAPRMRYDGGACVYATACVRACVRACLYVCDSSDVYASVYVGAGERYVMCDYKCVRVYVCICLYICDVRVRLSVCGFIFVCVCERALLR